VTIKNPMSCPLQTGPAATRGWRQLRLPPKFAPSSQAKVSARQRCQPSCALWAAPEPMKMGRPQATMARAPRTALRRMFPGASSPRVSLAEASRVSEPVARGHRARRDGHGARRADWLLPAMSPRAGGHLGATPVDPPGKVPSRVEDLPFMAPAPCRYCERPCNHRARERDQTSRPHERAATVVVASARDDRVRRPRMQSPAPRVFLSSRPGKGVRARQRCQPSCRPPCGTLNARKSFMTRGYGDDSPLFAEQEPKSVFSPL
jgi:hypothetical protein